MIPDGKPTTSIQGIPMVPYAISDEFIDNGQRNPKNKCFCGEYKCLRYGLIDVSPCYWGFSVALSYPHFYKGDPWLHNKLEGLTPNKAQHESRLFVNLETGTAISSSLKMQSNIVLNDVSDFYRCERFTNMTMPTFWFDAGFTELEPSIALRFVLGLRIAPAIEKTLFVICLLMGMYFVFKALRRAQVSCQKYAQRSPKIIPTRVTKSEVSAKQITQNKEMTSYLETLLDPIRNDCIHVD